MTTRLLPFIVIATAFLITQVTGTLYLAAMPSLTHYFMTSPKAIMAMLSYMFFAYTIGQIIWGPASDRFGRRPAMITSLSIYTITAVLIPHIHNLQLFYWLYAGLGFTAAAYTSVGNAIIKEGYPTRSKSMISYIGMVMASGPIIGPLLGGYLVHYFNWHGVAYFLLGLSIVALLGVIFYLPETLPKQQQPQKFIVAVKYIFAQQDFITYVIILALSFGCFYSLLDTSAFIFKSYLHLSTIDFAWLFPSICLSYFLGAVATSRLITRISTEVLVRYAMSIFTIGAIGIVTLALLKSHSISLIGFSMTLMMLGFGCAVPACKSGVMHSVKQHFGITASLMKLIQSCIATLFISLGSILFSANNLTPYSLGFITTAIASLLILFYRKRHMTLIVRT